MDANLNDIVMTLLSLVGNLHKRMRSADDTTLGQFTWIPMVTCTFLDGDPDTDPRENKHRSLILDMAMLEVDCAGFQRSVPQASGVPLGI
ncbi:hypothetical protein QCA50_014086 [Cerrena zonata]|uniref:Uncharacterized protein n=1 Tax=Cerrena zonata TaxID=2478898 RepID=A0AAW0FM39_9APHY